MGCCTLARTYNSCTSRGVKGAVDLKSVEDCVGLEEAGLADYVQSSTRSLVVAVAKEGLPLKEKILAQKQLKEQKRLERA